MKQKIMPLRLLQVFRSKRFFLGLFCLMLLAMNSPIQAQTPSCDVQIPDVIFDDMSLINSGTVNSANGFVSYSCRNPTSQALYVNACFLLNASAQGQTFSLTSTEGLYHIPFQLRHGLTQDIWNNELIQPAFGFVGYLAPGETETGEFPIKAELLTDINTLPAGQYFALFTSADSQVLLQQDPYTLPLSCQSGSLMSGFSFRVKANILSACEINATDMAFGEISPTTQHYQANSQIRLSCTPNTPYQMVLTSQQSSDGTFQLLARDANGEINAIDYQLYDLENSGALWLPGVAKEGYIVDDREAIINLRGEINQPVMQLSPGVYKDTVTVTLFY